MVRLPRKELATTTAVVVVAAAAAAVVAVVAAAAVAPVEAVVVKCKAAVAHLHQAIPVVEMEVNLQRVEVEVVTRLNKLNGERLLGSLWPARR